MENKEDIRGLLKDRFSTLEVDPEIDLWPAIEQQVGNDKRKGFYVWQYVAVAASLVILFTAIVLLNTFSSQPQEQFANEQKEELIAPTPQPEEYLTETNSITEGEDLSTEEKKIDIPETRKQAASQQVYQAKRSVAANPTNEKVEVVLVENVKETKAIDAIDTIQLKTVKQFAAKWEVNIPDPDDPLLKIEYAALEKEATTKSRKPLSLDDLSFGKALGFASEEINKRFRSPIDIAKVRNENNEVKTFQLDIFNLSIKRKVHKQKVKKKKK